MTFSHSGSVLRRKGWVWVIVAAVAAAAILVVVVGSRTSQDVSRGLVRADPLQTFDPVGAGKTAPDGFRQLLERDQIEPVYAPEFTSADQVDWPTDMLVVAVSGVSESKAYPVTHLNEREMVIDDIDGEPILVSW